MSVSTQIRALTAAEKSADLALKERKEEEVGRSYAKRLGRSGRLQVVLPETSIERLETIREATEATSFAEVIRRALRLYEGLLAETRDGGHLQLVRVDGSTTEVPLYRVL